MADVVAGIGMSHSTLVVTDDVDVWVRHADVDRLNPYLRDTSGELVTFAELERANGGRYAEASRPERLAEQVSKTRQAVRRLREDVAALDLDVLIVFGDDQMELHDLDHMPALGIFYGEHLTMGTRIHFAAYERELGDVEELKRGYAMDANHVFPGHAPLATHLIRSLQEQGFDPSALGEVRAPEVAGIGHSYGVVETQLMEPGTIPLIPVYVNTYWAPNQIPVSRCYDLGLAVRRAVRDFPDDLRVGVVASGGLSHFSTDEELDRRVLEACRAGDEEALRALPPALLNGGSSEIRNWIAVAAACRDLQVAWDAYVPVYRTPAGTGIGLAFMRWS